MKNKSIAITMTALLLFGSLVRADEVQIIRDALGRKIGTVTTTENASTFRDVNGKTIITTTRDTLSEEERVSVQAAEVKALDRLSASEVEIVYPPKPDGLLKTLLTLPVVAVMAAGVVPVMIFDAIINF